MRQFFTSRLFIVICIVMIFCLGASIYTGAVTDSTTFASTIVGSIVTPLQSGYNFLNSKVVGVYEFFAEYDNVLAENEELKSQLSEMEQLIRDAEVALDENDRFRELLEIKEKNKSFQFEIAEVVSRGTNDWSYVISIDKGYLSGIEIDDCVITEEGMVGYVTDLGPNYAEVTTIIDTSMKVSVLVSRSREVAVCEGDFELMQDGNLKMSYIKIDSDIVIGDTVETSGNGGVFPKGLLIGSVERILPESHGISNYAIIKPTVDVTEIKKVFVIKDFDIND